MKRSKYISAAAAVLFALSCAACSSGETSQETSIKRVSAQQADIKSVTDGLDYIGFVKAKETKNYSFLTAGKIAEINVKKGDSFKAGDILAKFKEYNVIIFSTSKIKLFISEPFITRIK